MSLRYADQQLLQFSIDKHRPNPFTLERFLKEFIQKPKETTAAKERIESELNIAREIQMSILPKKFPPFPDRPEFDIYAVITPAYEVDGGDPQYPDGRNCLRKWRS